MYHVNTKDNLIYNVLTEFPNMNRLVAIYYLIFSHNFLDFE